MSPEGMQHPREDATTSTLTSNPFLWIVKPPLVWCAPGRISGVVYVEEPKPKPKRQPKFYETLNDWRRK